MLKEFKKFAMRGNAVDMAVGIIIGTAFGKIVSSLVSDIIMPPLSFLTGGIDFSSKVFILKKATETTEAITVTYGNFINSILDFVIIAFTIFLVVRKMNKMQKKEDDKNKEPTTKKCPYCYSEIPVKAIRCPNCTSKLEK